MSELDEAPRPEGEWIAMSVAGGCALAMVLMILSVGAMFFAGAVWMVRAAFGH